MCDDSPSATVDLPVDARAPGLARSFLDEHLCRNHGMGVADDAALLVSEAVTNAVRHGGPPVRLRLSCAGGQVEVRVTDASPVEPLVRDADSTDTNGRGVALIDLLSERWGVDHHDGDGKDVWFVLTEH